MVQIKIVNKSKHSLPEYSTALSAGMDLRANIETSIILKPLERKLVGTGLFIELPEGYEAQIRPRSGLSIKYGVTILNSPGTIDADYRGEIGIILVNLSNIDFEVNDGDRIAQMVISKFINIEWKMVDMLSGSDRGEGGFGHTGKI
jgi:dUTP pyrophosphatase